MNNKYAISLAESSSDEEEHENIQNEEVSQVDQVRRNGPVKGMKENRTACASASSKGMGGV